MGAAFYYYEVPAYGSAMLMRGKSQTCRTTPLKNGGSETRIIKWHLRQVADLPRIGMAEPSGRGFFQSMSDQGTSEFSEQASSCGIPSYVSRKVVGAFFKEPQRLQA
jgi:hypothetical protein